ncbi:MAG: ABC transporter [Planctomycetaceae bacterium]|nr:ABC transporter [Planctomycetaceae bacterium]
MLQLTDVHKTYSKKASKVVALNGVSLEINAGEFVAIRGPSGCGKTTMMLIAGGLLGPDEGNVQVDGTEPYSLSADDRAKFRADKVGFVFQQFHLVPYLSVLDNIMSAALASDNDEAKHHADELIARFHLDDRAHHVPAELSTGERQRTALARALLNKPKLLLADEPTGNLDRENADIVLGHIREFAAAGGSVLLVSHDDHAVSKANRTLNMSAGEFVK